MKKYFLLLFIFALQLAPTKAQWVTIPGANFVTYLQSNYPGCMNGNQMDTTCPTILSDTLINVNTYYYPDLTGVQYFDNLKVLACFGSSVQTLPALPHSLELLQCGDNPLTTFPVLPNSLKFLGYWSLQLTSLPILPDSLETLWCENNQLTSLPQLPNTLKTLHCANNQLTSLPQLPNTLTELSCSGNQLTSLPEVPSLMHEFRIQNNNIQCLSNLPHMTDTSSFWVNISNNPFTCVPNQTPYSLAFPLCINNDPVNNPNNCQGVNISGYVYSDLNANCNYDSTDMSIENIPVKLYDNQNNLIALTYTVNGVYYFSFLQPDTFQVKVEDNILPVAMDCGQSNSQSVTLDSTNQVISGINFPVECDTINISDLVAQSVNAQGWVFPGQIHSLKTIILNNVSWYNLNCLSANYSGTVSIEVTGPVTYVSPILGALIPQVNGNIFTYNVNNFDSLTPTSFGLRLMTDSTAQANDQICVHVEIDPTPIDADTTNNVYDFCYQVFNSYDPNMKEVYPVNVLPGYDDWFTYTIHFQNTGNAPAFNIRLRDTLDANLDINTFEIRGYSHPAIVSINGNNLTVRFNNIMLPDSTTDYEGSMGYFQYRIKPLPNLPLGTQIENTAYIYFDYNAPIITNTTQNNFQTVVTTINRNEDTNQLKVFPNPANEVLNINLQNNIIENCIITNALGQTVYNSANEINGNYKIQLNIADLNAGVYFVKVRSGNGSYNAKFIKSE